jgi:hypothetical protein
MHCVVIYRITFVMGFELKIANEKFINNTHKTFTTLVPTSRNILRCGFWSYKRANL